MTEPAHIRLATPRGSLAALHWAVPGAPRVLCVHGWMDNAASYIPLAAALPDFDVVAIDLPGHGHSDHLPPPSHYYLIDYLWDIEAALDVLAWPSCHLIGHSMGAGLGSVYAAAAPERVSSLILLDALGPLTGKAETTARRLRKSMRSFRAPARELKPYASLADMVHARQRTSKLGDYETGLICARGAQQVDGHYRWRSDPALHRVSPLSMTEEQALNVLSHLTTAVLSLTAVPHDSFMTTEQVNARIAAIPHGQHEEIAGHHHFHMDQAQGIAPKLESFILAQDANRRISP